MNIDVQITSSHPFISIPGAAKELNTLKITLYHRIDRDELDTCVPFKDDVMGPKAKKRYYIVKNEKYNKFLDVEKMRVKYLSQVKASRQELDRECLSNNSPSASL